MNTPRWHFRNVEGDSVQLNAQLALSQKCVFEVSKGATPGAIITELQQQFDEHCQQAHEGEIVNPVGFNGFLDERRDFGRYPAGEVVR